MQRRVKLMVGVLVLAVIVAACGSSGSDSSGKPEERAVTDTSLVAAQDGPQPGAQRMHFKFGPIDIQPGQNNIAYSGRDVPKPEVDGYITRHQARPRALRRQRAARRRHPPAPRRVAERVRP